jgi:hypothetical protein
MYVNVCEQPILVVGGQIVYDGNSDPNGAGWTTQGPQSGIACVLAISETTTR